jgi:LysR family transcriptional regulator, transcriptional activator of the cysJI operon
MYRDDNSLRLTEVGIKTYRRTAKIFREIQDLERYIDEITKNQSGELKIGCPQTPAKYLIPKLISTFNESYPDIRIILTLGSTSQLIPKLFEKKIDLAWVRYKKGERRVKVKLVGSEDVLLVASQTSTLVPQDTISVSQLSSVPLILQGQHSGMRQVINEYLSRFQIKPQVAMELDSDDLIKEFVRKDTALSFLERFAVTRELEDGQLKVIHIMEGPPKIEMGIGYVQKNALSNAAWSFLGLLDSVDFHRIFVEMSHQ